MKRVCATGFVKRLELLRILGTTRVGKTWRQLAEELELECVDQSARRAVAKLISDLEVAGFAIERIPQTMESWRYRLRKGQTFVTRLTAEAR